MKKNHCTFDNFLLLDIRVGQIMKAERVEGSQKLLLLSIDLGPDYGTVEILSGIAKYYSPESIVNKKVPVVANLEPKSMAGKQSNGFVLMTDKEGHIPELIEIAEHLPNGAIIC